MGLVVAINLAWRMHTFHPLSLSSSSSSLLLLLWLRSEAVSQLLSLLLAQPADLLRGTVGRNKSKARGLTPPP